ncbi:kinase-like domain-containing protein [Radiomyces spectabilis]|uniref:kinase-like domain-containing protein n=1 Tax=Radiomyces spectabilis TaxID=64574 RepID=UPI00222066D9|nr:kinase-like domain-containing protein [Radiomyces spectabilis]KAI8387942.1 kinase-like domain-containing protein [Radiomyces spectabilis]
MDHSTLNRNHPSHRYQQELIKTDLVNRTIRSIQRIILLYPLEFDIQFLPHSPPSVPVQEAIAQLYRDTVALYKNNNVHFDDHWHWNTAWRQALSFESLIELANNNTSTVINSFHKKSHNALNAIHEHGLERYMRWYPWRWFSDLVLVGSGGFSAVYAANISLIYDVPIGGQQLFGTTRRQVALKVVDEKILNEIIVQSRAFLALLFHGLTVCESTGDLLMIGTLADEGNLEQHIARPIEGGLDLGVVADIVTRLAFNLSSLHEEIGMCHRNIHPSNVLCSDDDFFLVDYRFSTASNEATQVTQSSKAHYGRIPYIAPEVRQGTYTEKSDVYSLGIIMWQLVSGVVFPSPEVIFDAPDVYRLEWVPGVPRWYQELTMACLEPRPENRPDAEVVGLIARKYAVSSPQLKLDEDWTAYVMRRREQCQSHRRRWLMSTQPINGEDSNGNTVSLISQTAASGKSNSSDAETEDEMMTASRVFTLRQLPLSESLINMPFHHRPFDEQHLALSMDGS